MIGDSPLVSIVQIRRNIAEKQDTVRYKEIESNEDEIKRLKALNQELQEKNSKNEEKFIKSLNALRHEIEIRDKDISRLKQEILAKENEKKIMQKEMGGNLKFLNDLKMEKEDLVKHYEQELVDMKLKHDQEIYILKKIKKN